MKMPNAKILLPFFLVLSCCAEMDVDSDIDADDIALSDVLVPLGESPAGTVENLKGNINQQIKDTTRLDMKKIGNISFANILVNSLSALIPQKELEPFKDFIIKTPKFDENPPLLNTGEMGFALSGSFSYKGKEAPVKIVFGVVKGAYNMSVAVTLPSDWNFSKEYPELRRLDEIGLLSPILVLSTFNYIDPEIGQVGAGLTIKGRVNLNGPLAAIRTFAQKMGDYVVVEPGSVEFGVTIGKDIRNSEGWISLPTKIGIDFTKLNADLSAARKEKKQNFFIPPGITKIVTSDLIFGVKPADLAVFVRSGIVLYLTSQTNPILLESEGSFSMGITGQPQVNFFAALSGLWSPAFGQKWLALSDVAFDIGVDTAALSLLWSAGIMTPISGIGVQGSFGFGDDRDDRVELTVAGKLSITAPAPGKFSPVGIILYGSLNDINFKSILQLGARMIGKPLSDAALPTMKLENIKVMVVPTGGTIGTTFYAPGAAFEAAIQIGDFRGMINLALDMSRIKGLGYMTKLENKYFTFTGAGLDQRTGTIDDGPIIDLEVSPTKQAFFLSGEFQIPVFGYKRLVNARIDKAGIFIHTEKSSWLETELSTFDAQIPFDDFDKMKVSYQMDSNTMTKLKKAIVAELRDLKKSVRQGLRGVERKLREEIKEEKAKIAKLEKEQKEAEKKCKDQLSDGKFWNAFGDCFDSLKSKIESELRSAKAKIADATKEVAEVARKISNEALNAVGSVADFATALEITKMYGSFTGEDIKEARTPRVTIELTVNVSKEVKRYTAENMQIDFSNPVAVAKDIAKDMAEKIKDIFD